MRARRWRSIVAILMVTQAITWTAGVSSMALAAAAADKRAPKIVGATMQDADGDQKADRLVLRYNEKIKHPTDGDGKYPFAIKDPRYGIRRVNATTGTKNLVILLDEKPSPDPKGRPDIGYTRGKPKPVKDMAGNEAKEQTFISTIPLPCSENSTTDFFANPVVDRTATPTPTGVSAPAWCAYPTITGALGALENAGGAGRVVATGAGSGIATFGAETFPLSLPEDATFTTSLDPDLGGAGLDATKYVVQFKGAATNAVNLTGGAMRGITLKNERGADAAAMVNCGAGASEMSAVTLDGASATTGDVTNGLVLEDACTLIDGLLAGDESLGLRVRYFDSTGVVVKDGAVLDLFNAKVHNNGGDGVLIQGSADLDEGEIAFNADDGLFVDHSSPSSFNSLLVRDNADNGIQVDTGDASFTSNSIWNNSRLNGWAQPQVRFIGAPDSNGTNVVNIWTGSACLPFYTFGGPHMDNCDETGELDPPPTTACDSDNPTPNQVHTYNVSDNGAGSEFSVGLYASDDALVYAQDNSWRSGDQSQNVDADANSEVYASNICPPGGIITGDNNTSDVPVT